MMAVSHNNNNKRFFQGPVSQGPLFQALHRRYVTCNVNSEVQSNPLKSTLLQQQKHLSEYLSPFALASKLAKLNESERKERESGSSWI